ncbi:MAG: F0F1 ATP synthase subunit delta [Candidatus Sungbacteria bacterium]|nr:F0F1 ATP synthase subunit delta [Candidatus Sungbacteria bacterium]
MKYSSKQYASVILSAFDGKSEKERKEILKRFVDVLAKNRDMARLGAILREIEREFLKKSGRKKIWVESVSPVSDDLRQEIEKTVAGKTYLYEKINPSLLAGLRILINDELLIDASAKRQIDKLFLK